MPASDESVWGRPETESGSLAELLAVADWRRRTAELYAEVRTRAADDPAAAHALWRVERQRLYRDHPASPVPATARPAFEARHYPYDPRLRFELAVAVPADRPASEARPALPVSLGRPFAFVLAGRLDVPFEFGPRRLTLFRFDDYTGGLFLPFRDTTNGDATYGGGRYVLDTAKGADLGGDPERATVVVDFNFAYQPSCAFDPRWACPLSPPENSLDRPLEAGERIA